MVVSQMRLANLHFLGNITYFLGKIGSIVVWVLLKVWLHELQSTLEMDEQTLEKVQSLAGI